jgi:hypothetical protein
MNLDTARTEPSPTTRRATRRRGRRRGERALVGLELLTGVAGVIGGLLLVAEPDGSLLNAKLSALAGSPFSDWRIPGALLATLVGGGFVGTGLWQWRDGWHARELSLLAGLGLVVFEGAELAWIGFQPLEAVFGGVGLVVVGLAWQLAKRERHTPKLAIDN